LAAVSAEWKRNARERFSIGSPSVRNVFQKPAGDEDEIVVHDVASGHLERLDEAQRRLFAEGPGQHHPAVVPHRAVRGLGGGQVLPHQQRVLLGGRTIPARISR